MPAKVTIPIGTRFGRLTVIGESPERRSSFACWGCRCDCGMIVVVAGVNLRNGHTLSCGCWLRDRIRESKTTHGLADKIAEYKTWLAMRGRCLNPHNKKYADYAGRGITICAAWSSFAAFYRDMGPKPSPAHSIDRIDNDGPYSPENCRWATPAEQARNRRLATSLTLEGQTRRLYEWEAETGLSSAIIMKRLRRGWTVEQALTHARGQRASVRSGKRWVLPQRPAGKVPAIDDPIQGDTFLDISGTLIEREPRAP